MIRLSLAFIIRLVVLLALCLVSCCHSTAAPAPQPKPRKPITRSDFIGKWECNWNSIDCVLLFAQDGFYACQWRHTVYIGSWSFESGILTINERLSSNTEPTDGSKLRFPVERVPGTGRDEPSGTILEILRRSSKPIAPSPLS